MRFAPLLVIVVIGFACKKREEPVPRAGSGSAPGSAIAGSAAVAPGSGGSNKPAVASDVRHDAIARGEFNRWAVRLNLPIYWIADANENKNLDPDEVSPLLFYPTKGTWTANGAFTPEFETAYDAIVAAAKAPAPTDKREELVGKDLDQGRTTLVLGDLTTLTPVEKTFVGQMMTVAKLIDEVYAIQTGAAALAAKVPSDPASQSLFRRNWGPKCIGPLTQNDPVCSAIPGSPKPIVDVYPKTIGSKPAPGKPAFTAKVANQGDAAFCETFEKRPEAKDLLGPFTTVRWTADKFETVPYAEAYKPQTAEIAKVLATAADGLSFEEQALVDYLRAASAAFVSNDWFAADAAWAKMNADNSKWFVRVGPDELYWEPCAHKAGFHLTFARINQASKEWQAKLLPILQELEVAIAGKAGAPYVARTVGFRLPDFIDIVVNAGDDRTPTGATIGQSLPNVGPVAEKGGRTMVMANLYTDPDSRAARRAQAESLFDAASMKLYAGTAEPGLLSTILHEATHNLGPAHEYQVAGKKDKDVFGGQLSSMLEELKAQTGSLFLIELLRGKKIVSDELATQTYTDALVWACGHISQGMYADGGKTRKAYSQLAAIQIGFLIDKGAVTWDPKAAAANGKDIGAFTIHMDKLVPVADELMKVTAGIKARGDKPAAEALVKRYVDASTVVPHEVIAERFLRFPKATFVYSVKL